MPIHLIWGDDVSASERAIENLIEKIIEPAWTSINLSRFDGKDINQTNQAISESRTPPFGTGGRLVLLKSSPICNGCSMDLAKSFLATIELIPKNTHLILNSLNKPDGRLKTTKILQKLILAKEVTEERYILPAIWDEAGQKQLILKIVTEMGLKIQSDGISRLISAIGNDSARLRSELNKLLLFAEAKVGHANPKIHQLPIITLEDVNQLIGGLATNIFQVGDSLLANNYGEALARLDALVDRGEPALRVVATLTGQIRGWLWIALLEEQGEHDVTLIAKAAGIANPKRIYVMRKQLKGIPAQNFLALLNSFLQIEAALKTGVAPKDAFRDGLLNDKCLK